VRKYLKRNGKNSNPSLEERLEVDSYAFNKLEVSLVKSWPPSPEFIRTLNEEFQVYFKYQTKIHNDKPNEVTMNGFKRFLCNSPLTSTNYSGPFSKGYGSYHQQYRLNGKLIAVGVIDVLNHCVSSVYFFYDPEYDFLNLGTYSALREIALTREINKEDSQIRWYYLGYYTHECVKMRYKGQYRPSYLLCPEAFTWHPIEDCIPLIENRKYSRLNPDAKDKDIDVVESIDEVKIKTDEGDSHVILPYKDFISLVSRRHRPKVKENVEGYGQLFGKQLLNNVYLKF